MRDGRWKQYRKNGSSLASFFITLFYAWKQDAKRERIKQPIIDMEEENERNYYSWEIKCKNINKKNTDTKKSRNRTKDIVFSFSLSFFFCFRSFFLSFSSDDSFTKPGQIGLKCHFRKRFDVLRICPEKPSVLCSEQDNASLNKQTDNKEEKARNGKKREKNNVLPFQLWRSNKQESKAAVMNNTISTRNKSCNEEYHINKQETKDTISTSAYLLSIGSSGLLSCACCLTSAVYHLVNDRNKRKKNKTKEDEEEYTEIKTGRRAKAA